MIPCNLPPTFSRTKYITKMIYEYLILSHHLLKTNYKDFQLISSIIRDWILISRVHGNVCSIVLFDSYIISIIHACKKEYINMRKVRYIFQYHCFIDFYNFHCLINTWKSIDIWYELERKSFVLIDDEKQTNTAGDNFFDETRHWSHTLDID